MWYKSSPIRSAVFKAIGTQLLCISMRWLFLTDIQNHMILTSWCSGKSPYKKQKRSKKLWHERPKSVTLSHDTIYKNDFQIPFIVSPIVHTYIHTYFIGSSPRGFSESILHYKIINQVHDNKNITMIKEDKGQ